MNGSMAVYITFTLIIKAKQHYGAGDGNEVKVGLHGMKMLIQQSCTE